MSLAPQRILVAVDFDELSVAALQRAAFQARTFGAALTIAHVYSSSTPSAPIPLPGVSALQSEAKRALRDELEGKLQSLISEHVEGLEPTLGLVANADPATALCTMADEQGADLIVVGSHRRSGLSRVLLGSVAEGVVRNAPCAVLVVRTD